MRSGPGQTSTFRMRSHFLRGPSDNLATEAKRKTVQNSPCRGPRGTLLPTVILLLLSLGGGDSFLKKLMGSETGSGTLVSVESNWVRGGPTATQASQPHLQETETVTYTSLPLLPLTVSESSGGKNQVDFPKNVISCSNMAGPRHGHAE